MRRFLIILVLLLALIGGGIFWLASYAEKHPPISGEQRIEVDING
jgi:hypothetical protein